MKAKQAERVRRDEFKDTAGMECPKCSGFMVLERYSDFFLVCYAWKCLNCGAVIDKTIAQHRAQSRKARAL